MDEYELGVNLAWVEIILNIREKMEAMQHQMEGFVRKPNQELSERAANRPLENNQSLVPVIQINSVGSGVRRSAGQKVRNARDGKERKP